MKIIMCYIKNYYYTYVTVRGSWKQITVKEIHYTNNNSQHESAHLFEE